ncbi:MAG: RNA methyltransferase [Spirochaetales bacterium]|nr:RNA methyltransferase [Spirochaetales bacterium]
MYQYSEELKVYSGMRGKDLRGEGLFIAEGRFLVERVIASGVKLHSILCLTSLEDEFRNHIEQLPEELRPPIITFDRAGLEDICGFNFHRGVLAAGYRPPPLAVEKIITHASKLVLCSDVRDPFNLGGLFRSASALGWDGVVLMDGCADPFSRASLRASMGSVLNLPWGVADVEGNNSTSSVLKVLEADDFILTGAVLSRPGSININEWHQNHEEGGEMPWKIALMVGNEGSGLSEDRIASCRELVSIPMTNRVDSLNVGVAAGILMYSL